MQYVELKNLDMKAGDFFMIDSSHVIQRMGDVPLLYNYIVPELPDGVMVYTHDVFLPYDYPKRWDERQYTEQNILAAFLTGNKDYKVALSVYLATRESDTFKKIRDAEKYAGSRMDGLDSGFWYPTSKKVFFLSRFRV